MDFNTALQKVGDFHRYQKLLIAFLVCPSAFFCGLVYFSQFFLIMVPDFRCKVSEDDNNFHMDVSNGTMVVGQCSINYIEGNVSVECQHGWVYDYKELFPTIATELNWVCEKDRMPYLVQTIFYVGTSIGVVVFGFIADRYGRKPSIIISYVISCAAGVASAFTTNFYTFNFLRFLVGATIIPLSEDPYVLTLEYIGVKKRTYVITTWATGYILFSALCPWVAYLVQDWRNLCLVTSAPLAVIPLLGWFIPESASWLLTRGRSDEAVRLLRLVARINKKRYPETFVEKELVAAEIEDVNPLHLFKTPHMRYNTLIQAVIWFVVYCCYHTNTQNAGNLSANVYEAFTYSSLVELPAMLVILFGIDWLGRRWPLIIASLVSGVAGITILALPNDAALTQLVLSLVQRVCITVVYDAIMQYSAEILPTVLRGRGLAFLRICGTFGLYLSPSIVYLAITNPGLPLAITGILMLVIAAVTVTLPETLHRHLPHSVEEGENFGKGGNMLDCPCIQKSDKDDLQMDELNEQTSNGST